MSYSLRFLKRVIQGSIVGVSKGDTRSLDYNSYGDLLCDSLKGRWFVMDEGLFLFSGSL